MAVFCSKCGTQLEGNERFCVKCGNDMTAAAPAPVAAAPPAPVAQPMAPPPSGYAAPPPQGYAAPPPPGYGAPGPVPMMGVPPPVQPQKKNSAMWGVIAIALMAGGWYYYHNQQQTQTPPANNPPAQPGTAPGQPGGAPGGNPGTAPGQGQAPPAPGGVPGAGGGNNAALVNLQSFSGRWVPDNGYVEVSNGQWKNGSTVNIQSATLECIQYDANGSSLTSMQTTLNGPTAPQTTSTFGPFPMGAISQGMSKVNCGIIGVNPAS
jgi:hypothetical protein